MRTTLLAMAVRVRAVAALGLAALLIALMNSAPADASSVMTATESLNVRSGPSTSAAIIGGLYRGETVTAVSTTRGWTQIRFPGGERAYVSAAYLAKGRNLPRATSVDSGAIRSVTTDLNLREGPGLSYRVLAVLGTKALVTLTGKTSRGYTEVINGTSTGWVSTQYLANATTGLPRVVGTRIATTALDIRTTSGANSRTVGEVKKGTVLSVTGATANGRAQIVYRRSIRWVTARYLANPTTNLPARTRLPKITGTRYATTALNIRSNNTDRYTLITEVPRGTALSITGVVRNGRMQIVYESAVRWVTAQYLSKKEPAGVASEIYGVEKGLKPNAIKLHRAILAQFPQITTFYGVRPDSMPDHPSGRALDSMIPNYSSAAGRALGYELSRWAQANAGSLGINYIIWDQHIWNALRPNDGWRYMADRGSDTANHKNHVHITVFADGLKPI